ncbi:hypothetical protein LWC34_39000 [Kibdelosporangium philippinense]|uniref:Phage protein n=1 Tax=Kibdelosporangium philippinense TaxID=211113 RepID=A0ABS8ZLX9_9PSEU|nr:hypothetical protein [Kibdelosporangium philippinense]MCE7008759.1 hypothetical protein [Kibdelosporangium philippinense]
MAEPKKVTIAINSVNKAAGAFQKASDLARMARIDALRALPDEQLCERHPDAVRLTAPETCRIPKWVNEKPTDCPHEGWWLLSNERFEMPVTKGCTTGTAEYLRSRLWLDRRAIERGMA